MSSNFHKSLIYISLMSLFWGGSVFSETVASDSPADSHLSAVTVGSADIPLDDLKVKLTPMTQDALFVEAEAWFELLNSNVHELSTAKLEVKKENVILDSASDDAEPSDNEGIDPSKVEKVSVEKEQLLERIAAIREHRTVLIDRLNIVLDELTRKIGHTDVGAEKEEVLLYRRYIKSVGGLQIDVSDSKSASATIVNWLKSKEGGFRWARHIRNFLMAIVGFWFAGILLSRLARKALNLASHTSIIMKNFIVNTVRRAMIVIGILIGLSALEINTAPLLAIIGAAGFVVAFALQNTLSNFASGLMIMFYRPFDVNDVVDVSGVVGKVRSMTLVTTTITTPDNKLMVVPNNSIWGNIITNVTGSKTRRVDLVFGIGYESDISKAQEILEEILVQHPLVLKDPEPQVHLHELADSSVNFICRPWVKTDDYWKVYWEVTRNVKERFDAEGISIPYPQRDVHVIEHKTE